VAWEEVRDPATVAINDRCKLCWPTTAKKIKEAGTGLPDSGGESVNSEDEEDSSESDPEMEQLPDGLEPSAVRAGLTAVIRRSIETPGTFDGKGWLRQGAVGHQPGIVESYSSTGSLYICSAGLLHLGLSTDHPFWTGPALPWTQKKIWSGTDVPPDHALA
jgi:hypothetical protein